jgi:Flp pilus assembly protein TadB
MPDDLNNEGDRIGLKEFFLALLHERDRRYAAEDDARQRAIDMAQENTQHWQAQANEWRGAMSDREKTFLSRAEYGSEHESTEKQIELLKGAIDKQRESFEKELTEMGRRLEREEGRRSGTLSAWVFVGSLMGLIVGMIAVYLFLSSHLVK